MTKRIKNTTGFLFCWMGLMAVVCVPSFIAGVAYTKPGGPATALNASLAGLESKFVSPSHTAAPGHLKAAEMHDRGSAIKGNRPSRSFDSHQQVCGVEYEDTEVPNK